MQTLNHPTLVIIRGLPGSGKSHLTKPLQEAIEALIGKNVVVLDPDATDYESPAYKAHTQKLTDEGVDPKLHAYRFLRSQAYAGIETNKVILWNQPFTNLEIFHKMISGLRAYAVDHNTELSLLVVEVEIDPARAKQRVDERIQAGGHGPSDDTFARFTSDYESFAPHGYDTVTVNGEEDVATTISSILNTLRPLI